MKTHSLFATLAGLSLFAAGCENAAEEQRDAVEEVSGAAAAVEQNQVGTADTDAVEDEIEDAEEALEDAREAGAPVIPVAPSTSIPPVAPGTPPAATDPAPAAEPADPPVTATPADTDGSTEAEAAASASDDATAKPE